MFFCINLVFATSDTRVIKENNDPDIIVNLLGNDYVLTSAVIDPITKNNIETYIVKGNIKISFSLSNYKIDQENTIFKNYYYRTVKSRVCKIRCLDTLYIGGTEINVLPEETYNVLKATNRINSCLIVFEFDYKVVDGDDKQDKVKNFIFKIVPEKEYKMYESIEIVKNLEKKDTEIKRPKKTD